MSLLGAPRALHLKGEITSAGSHASILDDHGKCSNCTEETSTGSLLLLLLFVFEILLALVFYAE